MSHSGSERGFPGRQLQSVGLLHVENGVLPHHRPHVLRFLIDHFAVLVLADLPFLVLRRLLRPVLVEQDLCSLLSPANLPAHRFDLAVGSPPVVSPAFADLAAHEIQAVASGVGFAGCNIRRSDLFPRLPGLHPGRGAFFDLLDNFTAYLLGVCLAPLIVGLLRWPFCHVASLRLLQL